MMIHVLDGKTEQIVATLENKHGYPALFWDDRHIEKEENNYNTYEFTTIDDGNNPAAEYLTVKNKIVIRDLDGYFIPFTIEETEQDSSGGQRVKRIYAEGEHMELRTAKIIEPIELTGATLNTALDFVLYNTRWTRGITEFAGSRTIKTTEYTTALAFLNKIASEFNVQLRFRVEIDGNKIVGRYVDALLIEDVFDGKEITFGKDVIGIRRIENSGEIYTALYAIGPADENGKYVTIESVNAGLKYVEDREALERWSPDGRHLYGIFQYQPESDEKVTPELLKQKAQEALKNYINSVVKYEVQAVALERIAGLEHEKIRKGMTVRIKDEKFNPPLYLEARVLETERSYTAKDRDTFVLGNYREIEVVKDPTIAKIQSKLFRNENAWSSSARVIRSATPPEDKRAIWIDITKNPEVPMTYDFQSGTWKKASPTVAEEIGAETPTGAQQKAETAKQEAIEHADQAASTAEQNAKQYAEQYTQQYAEQKAPSTTPAAPANFSATGSFKKVILTWDIDTSKVVSYYELYASQTAGFTPSSTNLIYKGKTSGFTHDVDVNQTWYYRLRAVNAYGQAGAFTNEVSASTVKIISDDILFGAVNAQHIADLAVTAPKLADGSITTPKITDGAITNAKIGTAAVGTAQIQDGAITNAKIANLAVDNAKIANLHGSKITAGTVTADKLNVTSLSAISANLGTVTAGTISGVTINGSTINSNLDSNNYLTINNSRIKVRGSYYDNVFTMNGYSGLDFSDGKFKVEFGSLNNSFKGVMETDIVGVKIYDPSQPNVGVFISSSGEAIGFSDYFDGPNAKGSIYTDRDGIVIEGVEQVRTWRGWIAPTLLNGWSNFGSGYEGAAYYKDALGFIRLKGVIKGGTMGAAAFVLPIGYRPPARKMFAVATAGGMGRVDIDASGNVIIVNFGSATNGYVSLDGIVFNT